MSARIGAQLQRELSYKIDDTFYWTDSTAVLRYVRNTDRRFHIFVANRIQVIRDLTDPSMWKYVDSKNNPADCASRGLSTQDLLKKHEWFSGPDFLWKSQATWPQCPLDLEVVDPDDPEVKTVCATLTSDSAKKDDYDILQLMKRFSSWYKLKKVISYVLRFKRVLKQKTGKEEAKPQGPIKLEDLEDAELLILQWVQKQSFHEEVKILKKANSNDDMTKGERKKIKKSSPLYCLDPFIDDNGLLPVGGRFRRSTAYSEAFKYPIILPKQHHVTSLIIRHYHENCGHGGRGMILSQTRSRYWIINGNSAVRQYISKCVQCRKLRATTGEQKMADLPRERITPSAPFTYSGVDYFGPFVILERRKELKRYGVLFTCLSSRAVHLESANSLETDSFLNALRRFIARRGPVRVLRSDHGTNLTGAEAELRQAVE